MTTRPSDAPAVVDTVHADQLRTLAAWCEANGMDGWAKVCEESAEEIDRLREQLEKLQRFTPHSN
jgi:hypothetical protein